MSDLISRQMTKQEAIERLHDLQSIKEYELSEYLGMWYKGIKDDYHEALDMAIEALNQGQSSDLISRQDAIDALNDGAELLRRVLDDIDIVGAERAKYEWGLGLIESYISDMKELPSAQKKGEWIRHDEVKNVYGGIYIECSECGEKYVVQYIDDEKYCRHCGADNRGDKDE